MAEPFALLPDLQIRWSRVLTPEEKDRASVALRDASNLLRRRLSTIDDDIEAGTYTSDDAKLAVIAMVKRAMINENFEGVEQFDRTDGPFSESRRFANPMGNLYISDYYLTQWFGIVASGARTVWVQ